MTINKTYIRNLIEQIGFVLMDGSAEIWEKVYKNHKNYCIQVNFDTEEIIYETSCKNECVMVSSKTTSNFSQEENFVVLECVDRLLEKGYTPNSIELEHSWPSGHGTSGRLDILVKKDGKVYIMIECKTYGKEFSKEKHNMLLSDKNGESKGQLLTYCWEEKSTEYLCLYASLLDKDEIKLEQAIIPVDLEWKTLSNKKELFDHWNKSFKKNGIFEDYITPYNVECKALLRGDLDKLTHEDSSRIFNQFLEILRHNAVSDKPNAFNKILNLFICKIIDEDRNDSDELKFQWKDDSTYITLQSNLEELYKQGMHKFLDIEVTDYSDSDIDDKLMLMDSKSKKVIKKMFQELRLQKNAEFAFKEVYNQESFNENAKVLKEVVELLQPYQFRYGHKQQFLGNFFEQLLNTSIKQESGQFFTPVPISRFMITSLPIKNFIDLNIKNNKKELLPIAIDYACGAGHFLTEYMDIVQTIINQYDTSSLKKSIKTKIEKWKQSDDENDAMQGEFEWAKECVYGIEKDYRLVKATKISTFLNGDGEANIIHADGLDKFTSVKYKGSLKSTLKENGNFDFIIANPPYSVSAFKQTLPSNQEDFETYCHLTENSSEIECLFVERTKQLLRDGGCAAVILPSSILSNSGAIYNKTRELLLKNFYIRGIVKMGSNTFMATGTNTVIAFLEKRSDMDFKKVESYVDKFLKDLKDFSYNGETNVINEYVEDNFDDLTFVDYVSVLSKTPTAKVKASEYYIELMAKFNELKEHKDLLKKKAYIELNDLEKREALQKIFSEFCLKLECEKLIYYLLTFKSRTILVNTGEKQAEKDFLGYEFSNRRGYEGIHYYTNEDETINSSLYDEEELNSNILKTNYYIHEAFNNNYPEIHDNLKSNIKCAHTNTLLTFDKPTFEPTISILPNFKVEIHSSLSKIYLKDVCLIQKGTSITKKDTVKGSIPVVAGGKNPAYYHNISNRVGQVISISASGANAGYVNYWENAIFASDCTTIKSLDEGKLMTQYVFVLFKIHQEDIYRLQKGQGQPHVYPEDLGRIKIPIPGLATQEKIIRDYFDSVNKIQTKTSEIKGFLSLNEIKKLENEIKILEDQKKELLKKYI